jgi:hypothetical protein
MDSAAEHYIAVAQAGLRTISADIKRERDRLYPQPHLLEDAAEWTVLNRAQAHAFRAAELLGSALSGKPLED